MRLIFSSIMDAHFQTFPSDIQALSKHIVEGAIEFHKTVSEKFLPSAVKFHYNFNMREFVNVFQGLCKSSLAIIGKRLP